METSESKSNYQVGQVWSYRSRPQDSGSTLTIVQIDSDPVVGTIVHVSLDGLSLRSHAANGGVSKTLQHLPLSEGALDESVDQLLRTTSALPEYTAGYQEWRSAFDAKQAGVFTMPVFECVDMAEQVITAAQPIPKPVDRSMPPGRYDGFLAEEIERLKNMPREFPGQQQDDLFGELSASLAKEYKLGFAEAIDTVFAYCKRYGVDIPLPEISEEERSHSEKKWWQFWL